MREEAKLFEASDVEALRDEVPGVSAVAPTASKSMQVIYANANWSTTVNGVDNEYLQVRSWTLAGGRPFSDAELASGGAACILGATVKKQLFGTQDPIGVNIRLQAISCQVVAVLASKGQAGMGMDQDDLVLTPLRTFQRRISGNRYISSLLVGRRAGSNSSAVVADVQKLLRQRRKIQPSQEDDFMVRDPQELISTMTGTTQLLTMLLGAVAAVRLLVGGIGIMNIMLVSVTERTRGDWRAAGDWGLRERCDDAVSGGGGGVVLAGRRDGLDAGAAGVGSWRQGAGGAVPTGYADRHDCLSVLGDGGRSIWIRAGPQGGAVGSD
ncbi:MAG: ABC transporter permease [Paludibaculum sp.]